jgi:hypothetical protein
MLARLFCLFNLSKLTVAVDSIRDNGSENSGFLSSLTYQTRVQRNLVSISGSSQASIDDVSRPHRFAIFIDRHNDGPFLATVMVIYGTYMNRIKSL